MTSNKQGRQSVIVDRIGYDKEGHTVYAKLGNGTETTYTYDKQRERLQVMNLTADGQTVMENKYRYDAVDNILGITNAANPTSSDRPVYDLRNIRTISPSPEKRGLLPRLLLWLRFVYSAANSFRGSWE